MIKWLKERQLGNTMDRKTIYEHLGPKFSYTGIIDYGPNEIRDLKWTSDGNYLVTNHNHNTDDIVIWENPNTYAEQRIKSKIDLNRCGINNGRCRQAFLNTMQCHRSNVILGGQFFYEPGSSGIIYSISLLNGVVNETIRYGFDFMIL